MKAWRGKIAFAARPFKNSRVAEAAGSLLAPAAHATAFRKSRNVGRRGFRRSLTRVAASICGEANDAEQLTLGATFCRLLKLGRRLVQRVLEARVLSRRIGQGLFLAGHAENILAGACLGAKSCVIFTCCGKIHVNSQSMHQAWRASPQTRRSFGEKLARVAGS
jgi:hypothetical protein